MFFRVARDVRKPPVLATAQPRPELRSAFGPSCSPRAARERDVRPGSKHGTSAASGDQDQWRIDYQQHRDEYQVAYQRD
jgi:hypothetical protein